MLKRIISAAILLGVALSTSADARFPRGTPTAPAAFTFNNSKLQANVNFVNQGSYEFLDISKVTGPWALANNSISAPVTPDIFDTNGYVKDFSGNASSGVTRLGFIQTQDVKPGPVITDWDGDGDVDNQGTSSTVLSYTPTSTTQAGTVVTVNFAATPSAARAGYPIRIDNYNGNWAGFNNNWRVQDIGVSCSVSTQCFRIDTGVAYTGAATSTSPTAFFTSSTTVGNVGGGLNGKGRYALTPNPAIGVNENVLGFNQRVFSAASTSNYPHNIRSFFQSDEATLNAGGIFSSKFLAVMAKYGAIRFLNWEAGNNSNSPWWYTRKPVAYSSWNSDQIVPAIYTGATSQPSRGNYTISAPSIDTSQNGIAWSGLRDKMAASALISQAQSSLTATFTSSSRTVTVTGNNYLVGDRIQFSSSGGSLPTASPQNLLPYSTYIVSSILVAGSTFQITDVGSNAVTFTSTGSGTITSYLQWHVASLSSISGATINMPNHHYVVGDSFAFLNFGSGAALPSPFAFNTYYYVCSVVAATSVQVAVNSGSCGSPLTTVGSISGTIVTSIRLTLNVGGTGAKTIYNISCQIITDNGWPEPGNYRSLGTFTYNQLLDAYCQTGGNADNGASGGFLNSVPPEIQLELCRQVGAHPYWVTPPWAANPLTDYMPSLMQLVKTSGYMAQGMIPRFEPTNETWNTALGFIQTLMASSEATAYVWTFGYHDWYGKVLTNLGQAGAQIFGIGNLGSNSAGGYHIYGGVQTAIGLVGDLGNAFPRFAANSYVAGLTPQAPLTGSWGTITFVAKPPAVNATSGGTVNYVSHLVNAQYYSSNAYFAGSGSTQTKYTLASAYGGTRFTATFSGNAMTVISIEGIGTPLASGMTVICRGVTPGTTISGSASPWTTSTTNNISYTQGCVAGNVSTSPQQKYVDSVVDTVFNGTISGCPSSCALTVNSITSGNTIGTNLQIYGGNIAFASNIVVTGGAYPNFTLGGATCSASCNQTASFSTGISFSLTGAGKIYQLWATYISTNFAGITKTAGYEGNYSNDYIPGNTDAPVNLLDFASKQESNLQTYATTNWNTFRATTGAVGEFPSVYNVTGAATIGDAWSVLDDINQTPTSPQWNAVIAY